MWTKKRKQIMAVVLIAALILGIVAPVVISMALS